MEVVKTIKEVRGLVKKVRAENKTIGFVPTMGALHVGHISLIEAAKRACDFVVVSIFVNPTQFGPGEDLEKYPRPIDNDLQICTEHGADVVFAPTASQIYPAENITWVDVEKLTEPLCGRSRPGHFRGVTTVCAKLFNIVCPDKAFFGQKDAQQAIVITQMVADLNMPLEIVVCPTVRQEDGLAVSSRNQYLTPEQRKDAALIYKSLEKSRHLIEQGVTDSELIIARMRKIMSQSALMDIEYIEIVDTDSLGQLAEIAGKVLVAVAVKVGQGRLIDNIVVDAAVK